MFSMIYFSGLSINKFIMSTPFILYILLLPFYFICFFIFFFHFFFLFFFFIIIFLFHLFFHFFLPFSLMNFYMLHENLFYFPVSIRSGLSPLVLFHNQILYDLYCF